MSIYNKLSSIQRELITPKGQYNTFGKYAYRSCEDILKALKPLCDANGCIVYITNQLLNIGDRNYVEAKVVLHDLESGEELISTAHAREEETKKGMDGSQITGASSSYARKYALAGLFLIDNEKDSDATNEGNNTQVSKDDLVKEAELRAKVISYANKNLSKDAIEKQCAHFKVDNLNQLSAKQCEDYINQLKKNGVEI